MSLFVCWYAGFLFISGEFCRDVLQLVGRVHEISGVGDAVVTDIAVECLKYCEGACGGASCHLVGY